MMPIERVKQEPQTVATRWPPRLARLYSEEVRRLEARHAAALAPGTKTWEAAVEALYKRVVAAGPVKGAALIKRAADYLNGARGDQRAHLVLVASGSSRAAGLMFITFAIGSHPDPAVKEHDGLNIKLHIVECSRTRHSWATRIPVAYISKHAIKRLYERGYDVSENHHASGVFAFVGVLGYLMHHTSKHDCGGMALAFSGILLAGGMGRAVRTATSGEQVEENFFDVRTVLPVDELGESKWAQLEQGRLATAAVTEWVEGDEIDEKVLAEGIPALPRRADHYSMRAGATR